MVNRHDKLSVSLVKSDTPISALGFPSILLVTANSSVPFVSSKHLEIILDSFLDHTSCPSPIVNPVDYSLMMCLYSEESRTLLHFHSPWLESF